MARHQNHTTPKIVSGVLYTDDAATTGTWVGSPAWFTWLDSASTFYFEGRPDSLTLTAHCEHRQRGARYWIAYRRHQGTLYRFYLSKADLLTLDYLQAAALTLASVLEKGTPIA